MTAHMLSGSGMGLVIGAFVASAQWSPQADQDRCFSIAALWLHSTNLEAVTGHWKPAGNTNTALVPLSVGLYEFPLLAKLFADLVILEERLIKSKPDSSLSSRVVGIGFRGVCVLKFVGA
ncbi:MAG: hypothetical protein IPI91_19900 [Flavobacteriales bacterium]|nr:hypothetical protein [Flavobacteriales bacterium]